MSKDLEFSKAERERLRSELNALAKKREKLNEAGIALAAAERARDAFEASESDAVSKWASMGCSGARPTPDAAKHVRLSSVVVVARRNVESSAPAIAEIDAARDVLGDKIEENRRAIETAACATVAGDFVKLGERATVLRKELKTIEADLTAGLYFFTEKADRFYADFRRRNASLDLPIKAATAALPELDPGESRPLADRTAVEAHRAAFQNLQD